MLVETPEAATEAYDIRGGSGAAVGEEAIALATALVRELPAEARYKARLASATVKTGSAIFYGRSQERGIALFRAADLEQELHRADSDNPARQLGLSAAHHFLGVALGEAGNLPMAELTCARRCAWTSSAPLRRRTPRRPTSPTMTWNGRCGLRDSMRMDLTTPRQRWSLLGR